MVGFVIRDGAGTCITTFAKKIAASSPLMAETLAMREVVLLASNLSLTDVIFEADNLSLIETCRGNLVREEIKNLIEDIVQMKSQFHHCGFTWTAREGNGVSHCIAFMANTDELHGNWILSPPDRLRQAFVVDAQNLRATI